MSEKPHTVAIGAFIVGALLIALATVLFVLGSGFGDKEKVIMVFDGSVKGLNVGAPLALRGVQVGQVTNIELILDSDNVELIMLVEADFHSKNIRRQGSVSEDLTEELIARGLRAQLNSQSLLTGLLYIQMDFHPGSDLNLADIDSPYFQFPTIPTNLERITKKLQDLDISKLTKDLENIAKGLNVFVNSEDFQGMPADLATTLDSLTGLSNQLQQQLATTGPKVDQMLDGANTQLPKLSGMVASNLETINDATVAFEKTMTDIEGLVAYDSATIYRLNQALQELTRAGRALQLLAKTLEEQPESLIRGKSGDK
jgi:paraquat-inducible protein B